MLAKDFLETMEELEDVEELREQNAVMDQTEIAIAITLRSSCWTSQS